VILNIVGFIVNLNLPQKISMLILASSKAIGRLLYPYINKRLIEPFILYLMAIYWQNNKLRSDTPVMRYYN